MEITPTFPVITLSFSIKIIYKQPTLTAVHYTNFLATDPNLYLALALYLINTTYKDEVITDVL